MELRRYLDLLRSRWRLIALCALVGAIGGSLASKAPARYSARSTIYVGSRTIDDSPDSRDLSNDRSNAVMSMAVTFAKMIDSEPITAQAIARTGAPLTARSLVGATTATLEPGTRLLYVTVVDADPAQARDLANALVEVFVGAVQAFEPGLAPSEGDIPTLPAYVFQRASFPTRPIPSDAARATTVGLMLGLAASVALVMLIDVLDVTVRDADDAERKLELPVLGAIPVLGSELPTAGGAHTRMSAPAPW